MFVPILNGGIDIMSEGTDDIVLDMEMLATLFEGLNEEPDLFHALQFVTLSEAAVLRDHLIVAAMHDGSAEQRAERDSERAIVEQFMQPLIEAEAVRIEEVQIPQSTRVPIREYEAFSNALVVQAQDDPLANMAVMAGRSLIAERLRSKPSTNLPLQQMFYEMSANVRGDHSICDLSGHYRSLATALDELRQGLRVNAAAYEVVPLPPIGLEVFRAARSIDHLPGAILMVREKFADLRMRLRTLQEFLDDQSVSPMKKRTLMNKWMDGWKNLDSKYELTSAVGVANTNSAIYKLAPDVPGAMALDPSSWIKLITTVVQQWPDLWTRWRLRALHRTLDSYMKSPDRALGEAVEKVIDRPVTDDEVRDMRELQELVAEYRTIAVATYYAEEQ
jgi:hypothetical protein